MAAEGASSSSDSIDDVEDRQEKQPVLFVSSFNSNVNDSCTAVTSSSHMGSGSQVFLLGKESSSTVSNPFAIKSATPTRSVADSTDSKDARPLLAPPTLKLGNSDTPKIVLRESALSAQADKLKLNKHELVVQQEGKENSSSESNAAKVPRLSMWESNGKSSKAEILASGISSPSEAMSAMSCPSNASSVESTFSLAGKSNNDQSCNGGFIFGQNLQDKALNYSTQQQSSSPTDSHNLTFEEAALQKEELEQMERENQEGKNLFSTKLQSDINNVVSCDNIESLFPGVSMHDDDDDAEEKLKKSLSESAKEYESKQVKRKFDEVTVITGEEEELNVIQINCKLFSFDKVGMNWQERGRGILRLNDKEHRGILNSRVVMRTQGSLRVVLNTKVWAGMSVEHPSQKTVRLTAYDPQGVKVFLVMAQPKDAEQLFQALDWRVATLKAKDSAKQPLRNCENESTIEEATSSSNLPDLLCNDSCDNSSNLDKPSSEACYADSSSETNFVPQDSSGDGVADSTDITQS